MRRHRQLTREIDTGTARCTAARETLARYDRVLHRHGHAGEINGARTILGWLPARVDQLRGEAAQLADDLHDAPGQAAGAPTAGAATPDAGPPNAAPSEPTSTETSRPDSTHVRHHPTRTITDQLGVRPADRHAAERWDQAAVRLDRHHNAYGTPELPTALERATGFPYTAQAISAADTRRAIDQLTRTLHPEHDRDLGLSL